MIIIYDVTRCVRCSTTCSPTWTSPRWQQLAVSLLASTVLLFHSIGAQEVCSIVRLRIDLKEPNKGDAAPCLLKLPNQAQQEWRQDCKVPESCGG